MAPGTRLDESSGSGGRSGRRSVVPWIGPVVVILIVLSTALAVGFGPPAHLATDGSLLRDLNETLIKPADQLALGSWYVVTIVVAFVALGLSRRGGALRSGGPGLVTVSAVAAALVVASMLWSIDPLKLWSGLTTSDLMVGLLSAVALVAGLASPDPRWRFAGAIAIGLALALAIPSWFQVPATVGDPMHFGYTSDEVSAVAAGHIPLSDYVPQYSVLLPYLFAIPLTLFPANAPMVALCGLLILQVVTLGVAAAIPAVIGGRRYVGAAMAIVVGPVFLPIANGTTPATYFQGMPLRDFLPVVTLLVTLLLLRRRREVKWSSPWRWLGLGVLIAVTALNNPDFGLAAATAVVVTVLVSNRTVRAASRSLVLLLLGATVPPVLYSLFGQLSGRPIDWSTWLVFQEVFGAAGLLNVAMPAFGLHVGLVALFAATSATGFVLVLRAPRGAASFAYQQGIVLALVGGWSLLCLPYLAGRSLPATFVGGYAFNAALVSAALLPLVVRGWRSVRAGLGRPSAAAGLALPLLAIGGMLACLPSLPSPSAHFEKLQNARGPAGRYAPLAAQQRRLADAVPVDRGPDLTVVLAAGHVVQALQYANLVELTSGLQSVAVASSPEYAEAARWFSARQCERTFPGGTQYLLLRTTTAKVLQADPVCSGYAEWSQMHLYAAPGQTSDLMTFALVPIAAP